MSTDTDADVTSPVVKTRRPATPYPVGFNRPLQHHVVPFRQCHVHVVHSPGSCPGHTAQRYNATPLPHIDAVDVDASHTRCKATGHAGRGKYPHRADAEHQVRVAAPRASLPGPSASKIGAPPSLSRMGHEHRFADDRDSCHCPSGVGHDRLYRYPRSLATASQGAGVSPTSACRRYNISDNSR